MLSKKNESDLGSGEMQAKPVNAVELLKKDHRKVSGLFKQFEEAEGDDKVALAQQICTELTIHATCEEKLFYPAARKALDEDSEDLIDEAAVEHRSLKNLIAEIDGQSADDKLFEANVTVLKEYVEHHVKEEENEMFPKLESSELDLEALGAKLMQMKTELMQAIGAPKAPRTGAKARVHVPSVERKAKSSSSTSKSAGNRSSHSTHH